MQEGVKHVFLMVIFQNILKPHSMFVVFSGFPLRCPCAENQNGGKTLQLQVKNQVKDIIHHGTNSRDH